MGNYKVTHKGVDNTKLPRVQAQPNYQVKTRPPTRNNSWRNNILLKVRQQQLADQAMPLARRKCIDPVLQYQKCQANQGGFWYVFNCQEDFHYVSQCFQHQFNVQMDKRRRNMTRNPQKWWRQLYDQNGQIGKQAAMPQYWRYILFGFEKQNKS